MGYNVISIGAIDDNNTTDLTDDTIAHYSSMVSNAALKTVMEMLWQLQIYPTQHLNFVRLNVRAGKRILLSLQHLKS